MPRPADVLQAVAHARMIASNTISNWQQHQFIPIRDSGKFARSLKHLDSELQSNPMLSPMQATNLVTSIREFLCAFSLGKYDAYKYFRFPTGFTYNITPAGSNRIDDYFSSLPPLRPVSYAFFNYWQYEYKPNWHPPHMPNWRSQYESKRPEFATNKFQVPVNIKAKFQRLLYDYSWHNYYSNYISAVCFTDLVIRIAKYHDRILPLKECNFSNVGLSPGFRSVTTNFPNLSYCDFGDYHYKIFNIQPTIKNVLAKEGGVLCANCFILVRIECPHETYKPFLLRFYWVNKRSKWLPDDIIDANFFTATNSNYLVLF